MKGRNNYLCRKKLYDLTGQPVLSGLEEIEHYRAMPPGNRRPERRSGRADGFARGPVRCGTSWMRVPIPAWGRSAVRGTNCFITEMRRRAAESDIIIVNHHLFFADLGSSNWRSTRRMRESFRKPGL